MSTLHPDEINAICYGDHGSPFNILGIHPFADDKTVVRALRPNAQRLAFVDESTKDAEPLEMTQISEMGLFEIILEPQAEITAYHFLEIDGANEELRVDDPYRFALSLTDFDLYLHAEGRFWEIYEKFGAHAVERDGVTGVNFVVWAPNARRLSVVGDFNDWDARIHPMQQHGKSGVWELFIPGVKVGHKYKYDLKSHLHLYQGQKIDPYGFFAERRPNTASIVVELDTYDWGDGHWMETRGQADPLHEPMSIYEVHLGSWKRGASNRWLTYRELADQLVSYVKEMGYTHIEFMPVAEHPFDGSWGYQVTGYYAPSSRYGTPQDFMYLVDQCHQNGIGVIVDWVPAHFPKDGHALSFFDGTHLYSHEDPRQGEHPDWGTYIFNYGRNEVRNFLIANALFWLDKYHIDGLRVDAVSSMVYLNFSREEGEWIPNDYGGTENLEAVTFLQEANAVIHEKFPGAITIAEESTAWPLVSRPTYLGGLGFTFKWNMGWMHDTLSYVSKDPIYRKWEHHKLTFAMMYAYNENFVLSISHDEVVHGKGSLMGKFPGDWWQKFAQLRLLWGYQYSHPGKKLNFMGGDIGQWSEWSETRSLDWHLLDLPTHEQVNQFVRDLNHLYKAQPALYERDYDPAGFRWLEADDAENSIYAFIRFAQDTSDFLVIACNFTPIPRENYRVGVPEAGFYDELINSDADIYGGGNVGNYGGFHTDSIWAQGYEQSLNLRVPPLGIVIMKINRTKS